ncbi:MAG TPA: tape measure protein, partial [Chthoniobacteraceae bacterium]
YGKAKVQGRLFAEDINQLTGRGIPIIGEFAKQFGVAESEVKKLVESGAIGFSNLEQAFKSLTGEGGKFFGMMEQQSGTLQGKVSTFNDEMNALKRTLANDWLDSLKEAVSLLTQAAAQAGAIKRAMTGEGEYDVSKTNSQNQQMQSELAMRQRAGNIDNLIALRKTRGADTSDLETEKAKLIAQADASRDHRVGTPEQRKKIKADSADAALDKGLAELSKPSVASNKAAGLGDNVVRPPAMSEKDSDQLNKDLAKLTEEGERLHKQQRNAEDDAEKARQKEISESRKITEEREKSLAAAQAETMAIEAESRGQTDVAAALRIKAEFEERIAKAKRDGNKELAEELQKQQKLAQQRNAQGAAQRRRERVQLSLGELASEGRGAVRGQARRAQRLERQSRGRALRGDLSGAEDAQKRADGIKKGIGVLKDSEKGDDFKGALDSSSVLKEIKDNTAKLGVNL